MDIRADLELLLPDATTEEIDSIIEYIARPGARVAAEEELYKMQVDAFLLTLGTP